jgi:hypothetical protein
MSPGCYFLKASNLTFHDLTQDQVLPPTAASLLGLGLKFIPTPKPLPSATDITPSLNRIKQDINLKTFFAARSDDEDYLVLRAKSIWQPPLPLQRIGLQVTSFIKNLQGLFARRRSVKNLTPRQRCLLADLRENKSILIASADKNLGPIRIETERYIQLGLGHLLDTSTYKLLTKHDAHQDALALKTKIYDMTGHFVTGRP